MKQISEMVMGVPEFGDDDYSPSRPIASTADFLSRLDDALFDARRFADAYPAVFIYQSIASFLDGLLRVTADGHRPTDTEKAQFETMGPIIRQQAGAANKELLVRIDALWAYFIEWPVGHAENEVADGTQGGGESALPLIVPLDEIVVAAHRLAAKLKKGRVALKDQIKAGSTLARAMQDAYRMAEREMQQILAAVDSWAQDGIVPAEHEGRAEPVMAIRRHLENYLHGETDEILQLRRSLTAWRNRSTPAVNLSQVASFDALVAVIHQARYEASELRKIASDQRGLKTLAETLDWLRSPIRGWISELELPATRQTPIALTLANDLDLLPWPQLSGVLKGARMLGEMVTNWSAAAFGFFRENVYETAIDVQLLQTVSASTAMDDVARCVEQLVYRTDKGKEPPAHERREIRLTEAYQRELAIYASPTLPAFLARVGAIDDFWKRWKPPAGKKKAEPEGRTISAPNSDAVSRHDAERSAILKVQQGRDAWELPSAHDVTHQRGDYDPIAEAKGFTREYFQHILGSSIRAVGVLPMKFPFSRVLDMELRAVARATERGRTPTLEEQKTIGQGFAALGRIVPAIEGTASERMLNDAWKAHLHFQLMSGDQGAGKTPAGPAGMINDVDHFIEAIKDAIADVACLVVLFPNHDTWVDAYRQLQRLSQRVNFGRELSAAQTQEVERALANIDPPPGELFANVPGFATGLVDRIRQVFDYSRGRRASSRSAFDELLRAVLEETPVVLLGRNWDDDQKPLAAIDRQLRAMRRWTLGGRNPTPIEREATRGALAAVAKLRGFDRMTEWANRVKELAAAFCDDLPPVETTAVSDAEKIDSIEAFGVVLDECLRDCKSLGGLGTLHRPVGDELPWVEPAKSLAIIRRMLDQGRVPSRRERSEIHRAITAIDKTWVNPCPTIHDFIGHIAQRLVLVDGYYAWLVTEGKFAGKETGNIEEAGVRCVTLGGEMRVAFARTGGAEPGIYVCRAEKVSEKQMAGEIELDVMRYLPSTRDLLKLMACDGWTPGEIRWNAHSDFLAYVIPGKSPEIGWSETRSAGEKGRVKGDAFAWSTRGSNFIAIDIAGRSIFRVNAENGQRKDLIALGDDVRPGPTPTIAVAPGGECLAYTCAKADGGVDLCLIEFAGAKPVSRVRQSFPGAVGVFPFWARAGDIACLVTSPGGSDIISLPYLEGEAETLFHSDTPMGNTAPAWSATGKFIALFKSPDGELVLFDTDSRELLRLLGPGVVRGRLSFGENAVNVEGLDGATILWPHISHRREAVEKF